MTSELLRRLEARDHTLWPEGNVAQNRLGWLDMPRHMLDEARTLKSFADSVDQDTIVLLGMGGSSLGPAVLAAVRDRLSGFAGRRVVVCDTTDPSTVAALPLEDAFIIVSSKSGTTLEPNVLFSYARSRMADPSRYAVVTDPGTPLSREAGELGIRHVFENQPDIGGRYSVLSYFGLVPAALMGYDVAELCERAPVSYTHLHASPGGTQLHFGIREHAMASAMTGMALHGGVLPVGGTFFVFSDYARPAIRLAALSRAHVVYFFTHDSVGLGEDGPTHQPIEQLASLRAMPGLRVIRPADATETAAAWRVAVDSDGPTALILSRQDLPVLAETGDRAAVGVARGAYVLAPGGDASATPDIVLIGTGSEVQLCLGAARVLEAEGIVARVVSFPSWELFAEQEAGYRADVLPPGVPRLAVEAAASFGWERYADATVTIDRFGASAPGSVNMEKFGFTADNVAQKARGLLGTRV